MVSDSAGIVFVPMRNHAFVIPRSHEREKLRSLTPPLELSYLILPRRLVKLVNNIILW